MFFKNKIMSDISFRQTNVSDVSVLRNWDSQPHIIESDPNSDWQWETELKKSFDWRVQWIVKLNGHPLGFVQIIDPAREESHYWGEISEGFRAIDIWIGDVDELRKGYGTYIMQHCIAYCFANPDVHAILIDPLVSNTGAQKFYESLGFQNINRRQFGLDDCYVYQLDKIDWKKR